MKVTNSLVGQISHNGKEVEFRFNKASRTNMEKTFGLDTKDWIGQQATIIIAPTEKGDSIMLKPVVWKD